MRDYGKVQTTFWTSADTSAMSDTGRMLALYLLTSPHSNILGCFHLPIGYVCEDLKWDAARVAEGFAELLSKGFATHDKASKWVVLHAYLKWNPIENPNQGISAGRLFEQIPNRSIVKPLLAAALRGFSKHFPADILDQFETLCERLPKPFRNQEQEHYQEQNKSIMSGLRPDAPNSPDGPTPKREKKPAVPADEKCARWLFGVVLENNPGSKKPNIATWANDVRLMRERDGRSYDQICDLFQWAGADSFWRANILSPGKLRDKWDQLIMQQARAAAPKGDSAWWKSDDAKLAKGAEMGMHPLPGETMFTFEGRIRAAIDNGGVPPAPQRMSLVGVATGPVEPKSILTDEMRAQLKGLTGRAAPAPKEVA